MTCRKAIFASLAARLHRSVLAFPAIVRHCLKTSAVIFGRASTTWQTARPDETPQSAQSSAMAIIQAINEQKRLLMVEKELVAMDREKARRQRKKVSVFDARLRVINAELLRIG